MSVTRHVVKTETMTKIKIKPAWVLASISLPLESGQLERWYFHLGASNGISVTLGEAVWKSGATGWWSGELVLVQCEAVWVLSQAFWSWVRHFCAGWGSLGVEWCSLEVRRGSCRVRWGSWGVAANTWVVWGWHDDVNEGPWRTRVYVNNSQSPNHQLLKKGEGGAKFDQDVQNQQRYTQKAQHRYHNGSIFLIWLRYYLKVKVLIESLCW